MRVAIVTESEPNRDVIAALAGVICGRVVEVVPGFQRRFSGFGEVEANLAHFVRGYAFNTDAVVLIVHRDTDDTPPHRPGARPCDARCLRCRYETTLASTLAVVRDKVARPLEVVLALPTPAIEAWLLCGTDPHVAEVAYARHVTSTGDLIAVRRQLKERLYGTRTPTQTVERERGRDAVERLRSDWPRFRQQFPAFDELYTQLRTLC